MIPKPGASGSSTDPKKPGYVPSGGQRTPKTLPGGLVTTPDKIVLPGGGGNFVLDTLHLSGGSGGSVPTFVLCSKPIPGRNCLVVQIQFAQLMDGAGAGGAALQVS